jgi:hypothetical protein
MDLNIYNIIILQIICDKICFDYVMVITINLINIIIISAWEILQ